MQSVQHQGLLAESHMQLTDTRGQLHACRAKLETLEQHFQDSQDKLHQLTAELQVSCASFACDMFLCWHILFGGTTKRIITEEGARTLDHKVKSLALYQLSYSGPSLKYQALGAPRLNWVQVTGCGVGQISCIYPES